MSLAKRPIILSKSSLPSRIGPVVGFGAAAGFIHPVTGYSVAASLRAAPRVARAVSEVLTRAESADDIARVGWNAVWPTSFLRTRVLHDFGLAALSRLTTADIQVFFDHFFSLLPDAAKAFYETHRLRLEMSLLGIKKIDASTTAIQVQFIPQPPLDPIKIIRIVQSNPAIHLNGQDRIKYLPPKDASFEKLEQRIEAIRQLMKLLSGALIAGASALPTPALSA